MHMHIVAHCCTSVYTINYILLGCPVEITVLSSVQWMASLWAVQALGLRHCEEFNKRIHQARWLQVPFFVTCHLEFHYWSLCKLQACPFPLFAGRDEGTSCFSGALQSARSSVSSADGTVWVRMVGIGGSHSDTLSSSLLPPFTRCWSKSESANISEWGVN